MRFMILLKADQHSEAGIQPSAEMLGKMMKYNEELVKAGVLVDGQGLQASSKGARVLFRGDQRIVTDGPFAETKELIAGFWIFEVRSKQDAIDWVKRCPSPLLGDAEIEIRQLYEAGDFENATPEMMAREEELRAQSVTR
jgi:hypothetical protein